MLYLFPFSACPRIVLFLDRWNVELFLLKEKVTRLENDFCEFRQRLQPLESGKHVSIRVWALNPKPKWEGLNLYLIYESFK